MTTAVKASLRSIGTCWSLSISVDSSFSAPRSSLVPGRLIRSWEHLSLSLALSPFLDGCVLGRLSGSWEHHRLIPFLVWCVLGRWARSWEHLSHSLSLSHSHSPSPSPSPSRSRSRSRSLSLSLSLSPSPCSLRLPPLCSSLLPASPPSPCHTQAFNLSFPFLTPGSTPYRITACRGAWAFQCAAGNRTNHPSSSLQETVTSFPFLALPLPAPPHTFPVPSLRRGLHPTG